MWNPGRTARFPFVEFVDALRLWRGNFVTFSDELLFEDTGLEEPG